MPVDSPNSPVTKRVRLDLDGLDPGSKAEARTTAANIIIDETNAALDQSRSPVKGGKFKSTKADGSACNLRETGAMRFSLDFDEPDDDVIEVGVFAPDQTDKAYAHTTGFKGHPHLESSRLKREFIPRPNQTYDKQIMDRVNNAVQAIKDRQPKTLGEVFDDVDEIGVDFSRVFRNTAGGVSASSGTALGLNLEGVARRTFGDIFGDDL